MVWHDYAPLKALDHSLNSICTNGAMIYKTNHHGIDSFLKCSSQIIFGFHFLDLSQMLREK